MERRFTARGIDGPATAGGGRSHPRCGRSIHRTKLQWIRWKHVKVLRAIARCRTAALGGHLDECTAVDIAPSRSTAAVIATARSVRSPPGNAGSLHADENFSRPTCTWSSHSPAAWRRWCCRTKRSSTISCSVPVEETLLEVARNPKHLGAEIRFFVVLHTWSQKPKIHPHVHCVVPAQQPLARSHPLGSLTRQLLSS